MRWIYVLLISILVLSGCVTRLGYDEDRVSGSPTDFLDQAVVGPNGDGTYVVPTNQLIDPAGKTVLLPGRPVGVVHHPSEPMLAVKSKSNVLGQGVHTQVVFKLSLSR